MRTLKALVIVMGVLIVGGVGVIVVTIANRGAETLAPANPQKTGFGDTRIPIPSGSKVVETRLEGDRMILRLSLATGETRILVVDLTTGREIGTIGLPEGAVSPPKR